MNSFKSFFVKVAFLFIVSMSLMTLYGCGSEEWNEFDHFTAEYKCEDGCCDMTIGKTDGKYTVILNMSNHDGLSFNSKNSELTAYKKKMIRYSDKENPYDIKINYYGNERPLRVEVWKTISEEYIDEIEFYRYRNLETGELYNN